MRLFQRGDVPHIDDGFGEVRPLREDEAQVLVLSSAALAEPDPEVEALLGPTVAPLMNTWRRALALSAVGGDIDAAELDAAATELAKAASDPAAMRGYLDTLSGSARAWRRTLKGHTEDLAKAQRWITAHPNGPGSRGIPLLIESTGGGPARIIGGAGGKLNGQELGKLKPGAGGAAKEPEAPHDPKTPLPVKGYPFHGRELPKGSANPATVELHSIVMHQAWERQKEVAAEAKAGENDPKWNFNKWSERNDAATRNVEAAENRLMTAFDSSEREKVWDYIRSARSDNEKRPAPSPAQAERAAERGKVLASVHLAAHKVKRPKQDAPRGSSGSGGDMRQQRLFKSRLIIPIPARLAKSTLAPVATPAQRVMVSDRPAFWREANGRGVLQIPLDTGKDLLVLASDLALALVEGADELARVLSGMAPARALIAKLGIHKTARKPA